MLVPRPLLARRRKEAQCHVKRSKFNRAGRGELLLASHVYIYVLLSHLLAQEDQAGQIQLLGGL